MKVVAICKDSLKFKEFLENQGSIVVVGSYDNIQNNLDTLSNNIIWVDKFIVIHDPSVEIASEVHGVLNLLENPSGLLKVSEYVFMYKDGFDSSRNRQILNVVQDRIEEKLKQNPMWRAPHMSVYALESLDYDSIYRTIMGKSIYDTIDPSTLRKYRQERGDESKKSFEYNRQDLTMHAKDTAKMSNYFAMKALLAKTDNPANIYDTEAELSEYENLELLQYTGLEVSGTKVVIFVGDRLSGSSSHMTAMAISAVESNKSVFILDLSLSGGIADMLEVANYAYRELTNQELLNSFMALDSNKLCVYANDSSEVFFRLLTYVQSRPNIFHPDLLFVNCNLTKLDTVLSIFNPRFCSVVISSLMYQKQLDILCKIDTKGAKTLVWLNDNINSSLRQNKLTMDYIKSTVKKRNPSWRFMSPVFFEDFDVDDSIFESIEEVL